MSKFDSQVVASYGEEMERKYDAAAVIPEHTTVPVKDRGTEMDLRDMHRVGKSQELRVRNEQE